MSKSYSPANYAPVETRDLKHSPNCVFYVNGDQYHPGSKICISNRIRTFDGVKEELTKILCGNGKRTGYVRDIYTPNNGTRVRGLDEFRDGEHYVASLNDKFKRLRYTEIKERTRHPKSNKGVVTYKVVQHARDENLRKKSAMCYKLNEAQVGLRLQVSKNGDNISGHHIVKIEAKKKHDLQTIKNEIQDALGEQPIRRIYKVFNYGGNTENFHEVNDPQELSCGDHVLVMFYKDHDLKPLSYTPHGRNPFRIQTSPRNYPTFPALHDTPINRYKKLPSIGSSKQSEANTVSPFSNTPHSHPGRKTKRSKGTREVDYDRDEGGVYRSKKQNHARGAHQVNESRETRTEKPIDQMEAETVEEERVDEDAGMHRIDEYEDDSFNRFDQNTSGAMTKDPRSSTPASRDEARRKRAQKENEAAKKIQAGVRGYKARKEYGKMKESKRQEQEAERRRNDDEARRREDEAQRREDEVRRQEEEAQRQEYEAHENEMHGQKKQMDEDEAAKRIQASFKGHKVRKEYKAKKQQVRVSLDKQSKNENEAATKIQSNFRGYKARKEYRRKKEQVKETDINDNEKKEKNVEDSIEVSDKQTKMSQDKAAVAIQAGYKGYKTRKEYAQKKAQNEKKLLENKTDQDKREHEAASQIQANYRGYKVRKEYAAKKKKTKSDMGENTAATRIQASFRGYTARKHVSQKKESQLPDQAPSPKGNDPEELNKAATKIQSGFRGYKARKEYKSKGQQ